MNRSLVGFVLSSAALVFAYGVIVGAYHVFPYSVIKAGVNAVETVFENRDTLLADEPVNFIAPRERQGSGAVVNSMGVSQDSVTLLSGFFDGMPGLKLITPDGSVIRHWTAAYSVLMPDSSHIEPASDVPATDWNAAVHGMELLPDGSVVFNFDGKGTVKLDRCGDVVWRVNRMTHHSVNAREGGGFWMPSRQYRSDVSPYPLFRTPFHDDSVLHVSADGDVVEELMINQILIDNGLFSLLAANGRFTSEVVVDDVLHINDVEELTIDKAPAFSRFRPGDLLVSFRHLNLLIVLDPQSRKIRWYQTGPWHRQHDPDFQADGTISVFNNNSDDTRRGDILGGSTIVQVDPFNALNQATIVYGDEPGQRFFTNTQGKHQKLANGHWLIVEYYAGRVFEVDRTGNVVWEYINGYDEDRVARLSGAKRYSESYLKVDSWSCE